MATKKNDSVLALKEAEDRKKRIEGGILDTVQNLKNEKIRRREKVVNAAWYTFLIIMLYIGGSATLGWIREWGYQSGYKHGYMSQPPAPPPTQTNAGQPKNSPNQGQVMITEASMNENLDAVIRVVSKADTLRGQIRKMVQAELPAQPPPAPTPIPAIGQKPQKTPQESPSRRSFFDQPTTAPPQ